jgi:formimidoylglutamate deiminase
MLWFEAALLPSGWARNVRVAVEDGVIGAVETGQPKSVEDDAAGAIVPGLCNVHSHSFQRGMAGLAEVRGPIDDDFWTWRAWMYRFLDRLGPDEIEAVAAQAFMEMLESGFTRVGEFHYLHQDPDGRPYDNPTETAERICAAAAETGIGLTLLPTYYAQGGFDGEPPKPGQRRFIADVDSFLALVDASRTAVASLQAGVVGVAPHSLRAVSPADLARLIEASPSGPLHIHAAEQVKEVRDCLAWSGQRPVAWLLDNAGVDARWCLIHATHLDSNEVDRFARSGAVAGLCPVTESNLGDGIFPTRAFLDVGGRFGVGTDSNVLIDAAGELRALEYIQRLDRRSRNVLTSQPDPSTGSALFKAALDGGARAMGVRAGIEPGAPADFVELDRSAAALLHREEDALIDGWVFAGRLREVKAVWRAGEKVVVEGRHVGRDHIERRYAAVLKRLVA